jgi:hypothetical protein
MASSIPENSVPNFEQLQAIVQEKPLMRADVLGRRYVILEQKEYKISSLMESLKNSIEDNKAEDLQPILDFIKTAKVENPRKIKGLILKIHDCFRKKIFDRKIKDLEAQINKKGGARIAAVQTNPEERNQAVEKVKSLTEELKSTQAEYDAAKKGFESELTSAQDSYEEEKRGLESEVAEATRKEKEITDSKPQETQILKKNELAEIRAKHKEKGILQKAHAHTRVLGGATYKEKKAELISQISSAEEKLQEQEALQKKIADTKNKLTEINEAFKQKISALEAAFAPKKAQFEQKKAQLEPEIQQLRDQFRITETLDEPKEGKAFNIEVARRTTGIQEAVEGMTLETAREIIAKNENLGAVCEVLLGIINLIPQEQRDKIRVNIEDEKVFFDFSKVEPRTLVIDAPSVIQSRLKGPLSILSPIVSGIFKKYNLGKRKKTGAVFITFSALVAVESKTKNSISVEGITIKSKLNITDFAKNTIKKLTRIDLFQLKNDAEMKLKSIQLNTTNTGVESELHIDMGWGEKQIEPTFSIKKLKTNEELVVALTQYSKDSIREFVATISASERKRFSILDEKSPDEVLQAIEAANIMQMYADKEKLVGELKKPKWREPNNVFVYDLSKLEE